MGADVAPTLEIPPHNCRRYKEDEHAESLGANAVGESSEPLSEG